MLQLISTLPVAGTLAVVGIGFAGWLCLRRLEQHCIDQFHARLFRQAARWLAERLNTPEEVVLRFLRDDGAQTATKHDSLSNLLRIEFETLASDDHDCEVRVHIAIWNDGVVTLATIASRHDLDSLPAYVRRRLLLRGDEPAIFALWSRDAMTRRALGANVDMVDEGAAT